MHVHSTFSGQVKIYRSIEVKHFFIPLKGQCQCPLLYCHIYTPCFEKTHLLVTLTRNGERHTQRQRSGFWKEMAPQAAPKSSQCIWPCSCYLEDYSRVSRLCFWKVWFQTVFCCVLFKKKKEKKRQWVPHVKQDDRPAHKVQGKST